MIPEAEQGRYIISARTDKGEKILHGFDVKEYGGFQLPSPAFRPRDPPPVEPGLFLPQCCRSTK